MTKIIIFIKTFDFINKILSPYSFRNIKLFFIIDISKDNSDGF